MILKTSYTLCRSLRKSIFKSNFLIKPLSSQSKSFKKVSHVIFDLDGLLIDSEFLYFKTFSKIAREYGKIYNERVMEKHLGMPANKGCQVIIDELNLPITVNEMMRKYEEMVHYKLGSCKLMPGAFKLVNHLKNHRVPIAIATSSHDPGFTLKTKPHEQFFSLFSHIISAGIHKDIVKRGKPFPDIFLVCANRFSDKPSPDKCLVFEDSPNGVKAAIDAGMQVVMVPYPNINPDLTKKATLVIDSLEKFKPELFGLPGY